MVAVKDQEAASGGRESVLTAFNRFDSAGQSDTPSWLRALHKGGIAHFAELGFPTTKHEEWRFTNVAPIAAIEWQLPKKPARTLAASEIDRLAFPDLVTTRLVFVDGHFTPELSSRELASGPGLRVQSLRAAVRSAFPLLNHHLARHARYDENAFVALNTAFLDDGLVLVIGPNQVVENPVYIIHVSSGAAPNLVAHPRIVVLAQRGSSIKVIEHYLSLNDQPSLTNAVTEIVLEESARVEHCKIQEQSLQSYHIATIQTQQARDSHLLSHSISMGAAIARNNINCALDGENIDCILNGLYLGRDRQVVDHHTAIFHNKPHCNSHEYYHGILDNRSQGVFNGKIFVRPEAQKTDAKQNNRNLLLSNEATIDTKPQLEIFADDVKCTHGATIGQLDPESIFYLRARGIGEETARKMLLHAFASEIVNRITLEPIRERLDSHLFDLYER